MVDNADLRELLFWAMSTQNSLASTKGGVILFVRRDLKILVSGAALDERTPLHLQYGPTRGWPRKSWVSRIKKSKIGAAWC
jgi:hypothetical protein